MISNHLHPRRRRPRFFVMVKLHLVHHIPLSLRAPTQESLEIYNGVVAPDDKCVELVWEESSFRVDLSAGERSFSTWAPARSFRFWDGLSRDRVRARRSCFLAQEGGEGAATR